ncbi:MAG: ribonuclease HI [Phycisphaerales bacterium]
MTQSDNTTLRPIVELYTDGACSGNPGPGGWACLLRHRETGRERELAGYATETTNNRMELTAVIEGLSALKQASCVHLHSDSQYVLKGLSEWMDGWKKKNWMRSKSAPVMNVDLWKRLDALGDVHTIHCHWVRGHRGHPENEHVDRLAVAQIEMNRG